MVWGRGGVVAVGEGVWSGDETRQTRVRQSLHRVKRTFPNIYKK